MARKTQKTRQESRKSQRIDFACPTWYKGLKDRCFHKALIENIGGKGLCLVLKSAPYLKSKIKLKFFLIDNKIKFPVDALCKIVWCKQCSDGTFRAGLEFLKLSEQDRFLSAMCEKIIDLTV